MDSSARNRFYDELCRRFDSVPGAWNIGRAFPVLTSEEFEQSRSRIIACLEPSSSVGFGRDDAFWVVDDFFGCRTHKIEVTHPNRLTMTLIERLQAALKKHHPLWRVVVASARATDDSAIWIHPELITCQNALSTENDSRTPADVLARWSRAG